MSWHLDEFCRGRHRSKCRHDRSLVIRILRNIFRRKLRAFLTIFGIAIGVLALVVMGSIAEKLQLLVDGGTQYYGDKVVVTAKAVGFTSPPMETSMVHELEQIDGVVRASAQASALLDNDLTMVSFGPPASLAADDGRGRGYETFTVKYAEGRAVRNGENGVAVIGSDLVSKLNAKLGGTVKIRDKDFQVVGILEKTLTAPDTSVTLGMKDLQEIMVDDLPDAMQSGTNPDNMASSVAVYLKPGIDPDRMAKRISAKLGANYDAQGPAGFKKSVTEPLKIFNQIIYAIALVSLVVGGLSVINTMTMSVSERTREIGIRKAIGATNTQIMGQFIAESAIIGLIGGGIGLFLGWLIVAGGNAAGAASGSSLFLLTPRLAIGSVLFAIVLGTVSGLYPAWHASNLNPVQALRYE